jgi:hypothetical protein
LLRISVHGEVYDEIVADSGRFAVVAACPASHASATFPLMSVEIFYCPV